MPKLLPGLSFALLVGPKTLPSRVEAESAVFEAESAERWMPAAVVFVWVGTCTANTWAAKAVVELWARSSDT